MKVNYSRMVLVVSVLLSGAICFAPARRRSARLAGKAASSRNRASARGHEGKGVTKKSHYNCDEHKNCDYRTNREAAYNRHIISSAEGDQGCVKWYRCGHKDCDFRTTREVFFYQHKRMHTGVFVNALNAPEVGETLNGFYVCNSCQYCTKVKGFYDAHMMAFHDGPDTEYIKARWAKQGIRRR